MSFSDETLMAYADGELGEPERSAVEAAERADPAVAAAVAADHASRRTGTIASLDAARERRAKAREAAAANAGSAASVQQRNWPRWGALAASLTVGVLVGSLWLGGGAGSEGSGLVATDASGRLVARGALAGALSQQLAGSTQTGKPIQIGVSFAARDGGYCRSFSTAASAGLACREGDTWRIPVLREAAADSTAYRQAGSAAPVAVLDAIDERIEGAALDSAAERAARDRGWKR